MRLLLHTTPAVLDGDLDHPRPFGLVAELVAADAAEGALVIEAASWDEAVSAGAAVRAAPHLSRLPLFLAERPAGDEPAVAGQLFDGLHLGDLRARAAPILSEGSRFAHRANAPGEALAQYLACRPQARLHPIRDWRAPGYYRYPVVDALLGASENVFTWLDRWAARHVLDLDIVVDRLRLCDACSSAHLSYLDVCPSCASLDIVHTRLLHCFTCAHVGPREAFVQGDHLSCPKCEAVLRHIGVDYDRPIEQQQCRHCKHLFVDADVRSACMACQATSSPEHLPSRAIGLYRLGGAGLLLARQGNLSPVLSGLDMVNYIGPALFERLIDWQVALARRYPESHFFSVIGLRVANLSRLVETLGRSGTAALVDSFAERLRAMLRVCDVTTRSDEHLWLLAPHTDAKGAGCLIGRIEKLTEATRQPSGLKLELGSTVGSIPGEDVPTEGSQLMGVLASRLE
ncbi:MAG: hypothetical protein QM767_20605 [Anaeromyxobacter sp.]